MFKTILVPLDIQEPEYASLALKHAVDEARQSGADLHILTVLPGFGMPMVASFFPPGAGAKLRNKAEEALGRIVAERIPEDLNPKLEITEGRRPHEEIARHAEAIGADLIVMASHHHQGLDGMLLGSCARRVVEQAHSSVLVIRECK